MIDTHMQSQRNAGHYTDSELREMGFASLGKNVLISRLARIYGASKMSLGDNIRIDDFAILSGKITIGSFVHIGASSNITGSDAGVFIKDFCSISSHVRIFAISDDYSGGSLCNPCIPEAYKSLTQTPITLEKHCIIGSGSLLLPHSYLAEGVAVGAMSMVLRKTKPWGVYFGIPAKRIQERKKDLLALEKDFYNTLNGGGGYRIILRRARLTPRLSLDFLAPFFINPTSCYPLHHESCALDSIASTYRVPNFHTLQHTTYPTSHKASA